MDGQHREDDDDDDEEFLRRQADSITQTKTFWICRAPVKREDEAHLHRSTLIPGQHCCGAPFLPPRLSTRLLNL